jgi:hypothetical protein
LTGTSFGVVQTNVFDGSFSGRFIATVPPGSDVQFTTTFADTAIGIPATQPYSLSIAFGTISPATYNCVLVLSVSTGGPYTTVFTSPSFTTSFSISYQAFSAIVPPLPFITSAQAEVTCAGAVGNAQIGFFVDDFQLNVI